ncbi:DUF3857 and transglutaminase domain-containing protein [Chryseobacterium sp. POL2]|uniref:transglutaminase domain-containing protein n=1 Tax=Chryseobacterium sp. POL2 TaxID=2713414 RepID=UPI0013E153EF|nr:transglutaminase domain-containing protein [Chryseobacterium sp. POL2]QIG89422.1 DUF3857 and transglutaminase domain-containing protein [Chryseobacterium sp. POL2]
MKKNILMTAMLFGTMLFGQHKFLNIPKLDQNDIIATANTSDPKAPAEILFNAYHFLIDNTGYMTLEVIKRVKIYDKNNAKEFLNVEIPLRYNGGDRESVSGLKAATYNFENGKVITTNIDKESRFKSNETKNVDILKFAFANVKNGSVLEYKYKFSTPFYYAIPRVMVEASVPVKYFEYVFDFPNYLGYSVNYQGSLGPTHRDVGERHLYGESYKTVRYAYENIKAYKDEKYVYNVDNYRTAIRAELASTNFPITDGNNVNEVRGGFKSYSVTWEDLRKTILKEDDFGIELGKMGAVRDLLPSDIKSIPNEAARADAILKFVQKNYTWNKKVTGWTEDGIRNLISKKIGNSAEINLLLTMLMRSADLKANPVILPTKERGILNFISPSLSQINYVLASVDIAGNLKFYDGTSKYSSANVLAPRAYNYYGYLIREKEGVQVNIVPDGKSSTTQIVNAKFNTDISFSGDFSDTDTKLYALASTESYEKDADDYFKNYKEDYKFPIENMKGERQENGNFITKFNFNADSFVDGINGKYVFNPLLFLYRKNHDFDQEDARRSPIEMLSGYDRVKKVNIELPDGYVFENLPKSKKFRTEDNSIVYNYVVTQSGNKLTVESTVSVDDPIFPAAYYPAFKQVFDHITNMEAQVVTVSKK